MKAMSKGQTRRSFLKAATVTTSAAILAACQPKVVKEVVKETVVVEKVVKETVVVTEEKIRISWFEWGDINDKQIADYVIDDFSKENETIAVTLQQAVGNYYEKLQTVIAGGVAPDVLNFQSWKFQPYAVRGVLVPLDEYRQADNWNVPWAEAWKDLYEAQTAIRGKTFGSPWNMNAMVMFYAKQPFDEAGIEYPKEDWTFQDFVEISRKLTRKVNNVQQYGYQTWAGYARMAAWMRLDGEKEWDTEVEPRKAYWTRETIMDAIQWHSYDCVNTEHVSPTPAEMQGGTNTLDTGNVAMKVEGPWFLPKMVGAKAAKEGGTPFDVVRMPIGKTGERPCMCFGHVLTINAASKEQDAAWEFVKFSGSAKGQKRVSEGGRGPVTPEFMDQYWTPWVQKTYQIENSDQFNKGFEDGIVHLTGEIDDVYLNNEVLKSAFDAMVGGFKTAKEVIPEANDKIQKILDDYWAKQGS